MEDDNLILLLNTHQSESTTPIQQKREPLVEIVDNDDHDSVVAMTCLNDRVPSIPSNSSKRHFDDIKLVRPSSATSQGSRSKRQEKVISYAPHLTSGGNRNSTDNLIQSSIDITLSSNSSRDELQQQHHHHQHQQQKQRVAPVEEELAIVTIVGVEDNGERENEHPIDTADPLLTPYTSSKPSVPSQVHSTPDVQISRFDKDPATSKAAFARSQLAKRFSINQPQQRPVPIQSLSNTTNNDYTSTSDQQQTATSLAATVAASVAVSVAQPFLKLQNEFEQKMNTVLDQIHQQQQKSNTNGVVIPVTTVQQTSDRNRLQNDCVDTRMTYMEKVQEQQQQVLKQLADLVQTTKPKSKSPSYDYDISKLGLDSSPPPQQQQSHFLDTLIGSSSPPARRAKSHKKHHTHKKTTATSPSPNKRPSRVTGANIRPGKVRSPVTFKQQPPNSHFHIESSSPYGCSVCDRSRSRSRSRSHSPTKGLSPDSSYPRPYVPVPRPLSIMSDGFIPSSTSLVTGNALHEAYPPFDRYLNNSIPPLPLLPKPIRSINENLDLHERIKQIDEAKNLLDENYSTLQRRKNDVTTLEPITNESLRVQRLVEQCVKQVTRQVREEVKLKLEEDEIHVEHQQKVATTKKRPTSRTQLAFDRHLTTRAGKQTSPPIESPTSSKPYSDAFMEAVYGRSLYQRIKKDGKQPYFKLKQQAVQQAKQAKQIEQIPVRDTGLKPSSRVINPPRHINEQPIVIPPPPSHPVYEPEYYTRPNGVILLGPPQIRDTRTFQPTYVPSPPHLTPHILPSVDVDPSATKVRFGQRTESIKVDMDDDDDDDGQGIEIPGYHQTKDDHQQTYDGPRFPPTIPHDEGYRNRQYDSLQSGAIDWLEQELIARFMSQLQNQQTTVPIRQHRDVISARSSASSSSDDRSIHDRLLDLLGQDGFQLFIDMGQPIDQDLIQALTREVLEERIAQMIGFRSPRESIHVVPPPPAPPPRTTTPTAATTTTTVLVDHYPWPPENGVPTPQPTPPQSPPPPMHRPRVATPEITGQEVSSESEPTTPRSVTPHEDLDRPLPSVFHHSIGTPEPSDSLSPPSTPRVPQPPIVQPPPPPPPPPVAQKRDASTMASIELTPPPPPPVIIQPPPPRRPSPPKPKTPSLVSSTSSSSSSSSPTSSSSLSTFSIPYSATDSPFSDHIWFEDRSEGQVDLLDRHRPQTELILKQAQRLLDQRRRYSSVTPVGMSSTSPPFSPAGGTHTLSVGEVPPQFPSSIPFQHEENGHTTPPGSDESNNSGKSEGEITSSMMINQQPQPMHIKYRKSTQGFLGKKNNRK